MRQVFVFNRRLISENIEALENIALFDDFVSKLFFQKIILDLRKVSWIEGELCSILNAIIYRGRLNGNVFEYIPAEEDKVNDILKRNNFLSLDVKDEYNTVIPCKMFDTLGIEAFINYIKDAFDDNKFPFPATIKDEFRSHLGELFDNAFFHSGTIKIFTCGQYFPKNNELKFCITDMGMGIPVKVKEFTPTISDAEAMRWVFQNRNTTKQEVGGLGLKLFHEFVRKNGGSILVFSNNQVYKVIKDEVYNTRSSFKGTSVIFKFIVNKD